MSVFHWPRSGTLLLALVFTVASTGIASARENATKAQKRPSPSHSVAVQAAPPARYFTINQVLADRERQRGSSASLQFASTSATMTDAAPSGSHLLPSIEPFGLKTFLAPEGALWVKWRTVEQEHQAEADELELCRNDRSSCSSPALHFLRLVEAAQAREGRARIDLVNRAVNSAIRYTTDFEQHGVADRWTAPLATLASARGDCEDYAIAKYAILRAAGVPATDLRLLVVRDRAVRQDHAILAVRDDGRWLILDNRNLVLAETSMLPQFTPLFSLDHQGVSLFAAPYMVPPVRNVVAPVSLGPGRDAGTASSATSPAPYLL